MKHINVFKTKKILRIGQRIEITKIGNSDEAVAYSSRVEDIQENEVFLALPADSRRCPIIPETNQPISGKIIDSTCIYIFTGQYKHLAKINVPVWVLNINDTVIKAQNREFVRIPLRTALRIITFDENGGINAPFITESFDMSGNGISFFYNTKLLPNSKIIIETELIPSVGRIYTFARIKRSILKDSNQYLVGAKFIDLSRQIQNKLIKYLFTKQREFINKGIIQK